MAMAAMVAVKLHRAPCIYRNAAFCSHVTIMFMLKFYVVRPTLVRLMRISNSKY